mmetsp:Transcript_101319/g.282000  ORF Transcript_101319/g.282000 Transcript_101319/m.282000 type:complete len:80 (+) Transcript_101319:1418-1657(+)
MSSCLPSLTGWALAIFMPRTPPSPRLQALNPAFEHLAKHAGTILSGERRLEVQTQTSKPPSAAPPEDRVGREDLEPNGS